MNKYIDNKTNAHLKINQQNKVCFKHNDFSIFSDEYYVQRNFDIYVYNISGIWITYMNVNNLTKRNSNHVSWDQSTYVVSNSKLAQPFKVPLTKTSF